MPTLPEIAETIAVDPRTPDALTIEVTCCSHCNRTYQPTECPSCHVTECQCSVRHVCKRCAKTCCSGCARDVNGYWYCIPCAKHTYAIMEPLAGFTKYPGTIEGHAWEPRNHVWKKYRLQYERADYLGVELEVGARSSVGLNQGMIDAARLLPNLWCSKSDSSICRTGIPYGVEYAFTPLSLGAWKQRASKVRDWLKALAEAGNQSHNTGTCGLHVHTTRHRETEMPVERDAIACVMAGCRSALTYLSRREEKSIQSWAAFADSCYASDWTDRGALYWTSRTLEIRLYRGTLEPRSFWTALEFADALRQYARTETPSAVRRMQKAYEINRRNGAFGRFAAFVRDARIYPHLHDAFSDLFDRIGRLKSQAALCEYVREISSFEGEPIIQASPQSSNMTIEAAQTVVMHQARLRTEIGNLFAVSPETARAAVREIDRRSYLARTGRLTATQFLSTSASDILRCVQTGQETPISPHVERNEATQPF